MTEFRITRRALLVSGGLLSLGLACPSAFARAGERPKVLVAVFLRGAADGLSLVVPHAESDYYLLRSSIAIPEKSVLDLDGRFGLHPRLRPLLPAWTSKELAIVHAVGSPHATRSHFEAQDYMESGTTGNGSTRDGWLGRSFAGVGGAATFRAVAFSSKQPHALAGASGVIATKSLEALALRGPDRLRSRLEHGFRRLYGEKDDPLHRAGRGALDAIARARNLGQPASNADYPKAGHALADVAMLVKANVGLRAAWLDVGGWDTHQGQGDAEQGRLPRLLEGLGRSLAAFREDLGERMVDVAVVVMSEFGRTVRQNGTGGTDHGHGSAMLVLGGAVRGGKVYGRFPGLAPDALYEGRDLAVTTDFRDLFAELVEKQLGPEDLGRVFPGYALKRENRLGLVG
jgi:uncharacterized protein (DUF1501 family)